MKNWWSLFRIPKTYEDDVEGAVFATAIFRSPTLTVLSFLVTPLNVMAVVLLLFGNQEALLAMAIAGSLNLIQTGLLWNYGVKSWAAREAMIGVVMLACAVVSNPIG